jgi:hypothetical protein
MDQAKLPPLVVRRNFFQRDLPNAELSADFFML